MRRSTSVEFAGGWCGSIVMADTGPGTLDLLRISWTKIDENRKEDAVMTEVTGIILQCPRCEGHWIRQNLGGTCACRKCGLKMETRAFEVKRVFDDAHPPKRIVYLARKNGGFQTVLEVKDE